jgi:hypothetical protein
VAFIKVSSHKLKRACKMAIDDRHMSCDVDPANILELAEFEDHVYINKTEYDLLREYFKPIIYSEVETIERAKGFGIGTGKGISSGMVYKLTKDITTGLDGDKIYGVKGQYVWVVRYQEKPFKCTVSNVNCEFTREYFIEKGDIENITDVY